jgi:putative phosphoesterase
VLAKADLVLHVGDFTALSALEELQELAPVEAVRGNMDEPALRRVLPERALVDAEGMRIGLVHDAGPTAGRHDRLVAGFAGCDLVAYGHSHLPELTRAGETWIVNPGSPTERRRAATHTMVVVRAGAPELVRLD